MQTDVPEEERWWIMYARIMRCSRPSDVGVPAYNFPVVHECCCSRGAVPGEDKQRERSWCGQALQPPMWTGHWLILTLSLAQVYLLNIHGCFLRGKRGCVGRFICLPEWGRKKDYPLCRVSHPLPWDYRTHWKKICIWFGKFMKLFICSKLFCGYLCIQSCPPNHNIFILISW